MIHLHLLPAATASVEGKMGKGLKKVLRKVFASDMTEQLAVADAKLGSVIKVCSLPPHSGRESLMVLM